MHACRSRYWRVSEKRHNVLYQTTNNMKMEEMVVKKRRQLRVIEVGGTPYEIGFQYGSVFPEEVSKVIDLKSRWLGFTPDSVIALVQQYVPLVQGYAPELLETLRGIADGAKADFNGVCFNNFADDVVVGRMLRGCTSFAAMGEATKDGETIVGQSVDGPPMTEDNFALLKIKPNEGPQILSLITNAGALGCKGINSAGLGIYQHLALHKDTLACNNIRIPHLVILNKALASENIGKAFGAVTSGVQVSGIGAMTSVLMASREGDSLCVEAVPDDLGVLYPERGIIVHSNHFETERFKSGDLMATFVPDSWIRSKRLKTLMEKHHGEISVDLMKELMKDHNNYPGSICRHIDKKAPPTQIIFKTCATVISNLSENKMHISWGNPCENEFMEYNL